MRFLILILIICLTVSCKQNTKPSSASATEYFNYGDSIESAGVKMVPIKTPVGEFKVWTKRFGNNPKIKILLLHGGPALTHEYMEEVEQVRQFIGADSTNFYVLGNSWGGILAMEYALKYQQHVKGLLISNMVASAPEYGKYADKVLAKQMKPEILTELRAIEARKDFSNPRYMELLIPNFYREHICRLAEWPDALNRSFKHGNNEIYTMMQGPSEFGISGRLAKWDIKDRLKEIAVPTLMIGAKHDTMDPKAMEEQSKMVKKGRYLFCPNGSHLAMWDDQKIYMNGVIKFINDVNSDRF